MNTESTLPNSVERVDEQRRFREVIEFFGEGRERLAGCTHIPLDPPVAGLVVCPPLFNEYLKNYRREVDLSRALAARGVAVQRFSYRGAGNSDGAPEDMTFESLCADAQTATRRLTEATGVARVAFAGTRFGALVAATVAARCEGAAVVFLEPVLAADRFFAEGLRAKNSAQMMQPPGGGSADGALPSQQHFVEFMKSTGAIDVVGYTLGYGLYGSSSGRTLVDELGSSPRPVLVVRLGAGGPPGRDLENAEATWRRDGFDVHVESAGGRELWWFAISYDTRREEVTPLPRGLADDDPVVSLVSAWLSHNLTGGDGP